MVAHLLKSWCAFYPETTQGDGPAGEDWDGLATLVDHLEADPSSITQTWLEDMTLNQRAMTERLSIPGLKNSEGIKIGLNWHGAEVVTPDTQQVAQTALAKILKHCMGGQTRTYSTTMTGGTAEIPELAAMTGVDEGVFLGFEDADDAGRVHIRRIVSITDDAVTLDQALPFTPANGDKVHGCIITWIDEDVLEDFEASQNTFSWRIEKGVEAVWNLHGCAATMALQFPRNAPPRLDLTVMATTWRHETLTKETWTQAPKGKAPLAVGPGTQIFLQNYGTYTGQTYCTGSFAFESGINILPVDTVTTMEGSNMEGRCTFTVGKAMTTGTLQLVPHDQDWEAALQAGAMKVIRYSQVAQAGKAWAVHLSRASLIETPKWQPTSNAQGVNLKFKAYEDEENSNASNAKLWRSKLILVQA